jgi:hypothetical protein
MPDPALEDMGLETFLGETVDECPMSVDEEFARHKK